MRTGHKADCGTADTIRPIILMGRFLVLALLSIASTIRSQVSPDSLQYWGYAMLNGKDEQARMTAQQQFTLLIDRFLENSSSFDAALGEVKALSTLTAPDKRFRLYTWNLPHQDGTYTYYGRIQLPTSGQHPYRVIPLTDRSAATGKPLVRQLKPREWYGALYYQIIRVSHKKQVYYTLLGWDGNTGLSNKKLIDVLLFDTKGEPVFGAPVFDDGKRIQHRVFFEYAKQASMSLRYHEKTGHIVFDHLSPSEPSLEGRYEFYGPDFSYDALRFKDGKWKLITNYDARNEGENKGKLPGGPPEKGLSPPGRK